MVKAIDGHIVIKELTSSRPTFRCTTCDNSIDERRAIQFPFCDECIKDLRKIIAERRKPKVVEIGPRILGGENG